MLVQDILDLAKIKLGNLSLSKKDDVLKTDINRKTVHWY